MTITFVGAGTAATANNASVTPVVHASTAAGDLVLIFASIRNSGTGTVNIPAGWAQLNNSGNIAVFGKIWQAGDVIPAITFTGGVANADTIAQTVTFRGVEPRLNDCVGATTGQLNGSAQNIAYPALDVPGDAHAVVLFVWKQDDNTGVSTPAGFTAASATSTTTGDDASQAIKYQIQTTEADLSASSVTVTGGGSAISRAIVVALRPAATLTVTEHPVYPPRVVAVLSGLTIGDQVDVYRQVAGNRTLLRAGATDSATDTVLRVIDAELPFGVPVTYVAVVNGFVEYTSGPVTYTLPGGKAALSDAITGLSAEVCILAAAPAGRTRDAARFRIGGRNVIVSRPLSGRAGAYDLYVETTTAYENLMTLLAAATEAVVQVRQPGGYAGIDGYLAVDDVSEDRWSQDGTDERRIVTIQFAETEGWPATLAATGFTYGQVKDYYAGLTYADAKADFGTYIEAKTADYS